MLIPCSWDRSRRSRVDGPSGTGSGQCLDCRARELAHVPVARETHLRERNHLHARAGGLRHEVADAAEVVRLVARGVLKLDCRHTDVAHTAYLLSLVSKASSARFCTRLCSRRAACCAPTDPGFHLDLPNLDARSRRPSRHFPRDLERLLIALGRDDHEPDAKLLGLDTAPVGRVPRSDNLATRFQTPSQVQDVCIELLLPRTERRVHLLLLCGGRPFLRSA